MKRLWVSLLVALLAMSFVMTGAIAETNDEIELDIDTEEMDIVVEPVDEVVPEEVDLTLGEIELSELVDLDGTTGDSLENTVESYAVMANDGGSEDFEIVNGILVKYNGPGGDVVIPDGVTAIGKEAFYQCNLNSVVIPNSVVSIGERAFAKCSYLDSVELPNSVTELGPRCFEACIRLSHISIPDSVVTIGATAFANCQSLLDITIPSGITVLNNWIFYGCKSLTSIFIPGNISEIGSSAFQACNAVSSIIISEGVTSIGYRAFLACNEVTTVVIPESVTSFNSTCFDSCTSLSDITFLNGDIRLMDYAFEGCLTTLTIHAPCKSQIIEWAQTNNYPIIMLHTPVTDPAVPATCTQTGLTEGSHCSVCNTILTAQQTVPAKGHTPVTDPAVAPTLTQTGLTEGSHCSVCGQVLVEQKVIPKLISMKNCTITGISDKTYTGKALTPAPVVKYDGNKLKEGTDYTVAYKNNKSVGTATVTITGIGKYGDVVNKTFKINPKPVALVSLTPGAKELTVKWKKGSSITGYEVQYSLKKSFASAKKVTINKAGTVQTVLKKLTANKTYYVRIRTYKTVKGKKYYSTWSKAKSAKPTK